jgi:chromosome segregation ATPase
MDVSARVGRLQKQLSKAKAKGNEIDTFIKAYDDDQETIAKLKRVGKVSELMAETQGKMAKEMTEKNKVLTQQVATLQAKNASCDEASLNNLEAEVARLRKDLEASQRLSKTAEKKMNEASLKEIGLEKLRKNDQKDAHEAKSSANKLQNEACNRPHPNQPTAALTGAHAGRLVPRMRVFVPPKRKQRPPRPTSLSSKRLTASWRRRFLGSGRG